VRIDVRNEIVSPEAARHIYRVAINPVTGEVDEEETRKLRASQDGQPAAGASSD
jgi:hypothetical protein